MAEKSHAVAEPRTNAENSNMPRFVSAAFAALLLLGTATALSACNTVSGAGEDVSSAGHAVTGAADSAKH